ncbi:PAS domain S-box-containing protein [Faunimonas pinastri]|uniref:Blue-light-activated histidine kinase n=1 Tax=Faunimonas pinastri TaxID=1855383 RepID=A0A1H9ILS4_9HYPH|nr:PAS domain S-box protein [Faunimonas pinastri]SEQ75516.1 PAS domain S-box-containing protein [Faunimonas pinastri]
MPENKLSNLSSRAHERHLEAILQSAVDYAVLTLDIEGRITSWNRGATRLLGWEPEEILGQSAEVIFTPEERTRGVPATEMEQARTRGRASDERWHQRKDGSVFWANGEMMPLIDPETQAFEGYLKILRDRTEQEMLRQENVRAQDALRRSEEKLKLALDAVEVIGLWNWDIRANRVITDERFALSFSVDPRQAKEGVPIDDFMASIHPEDRPGVSEAIRRAIEDRTELSAEYRLCAPGRAERWLLARGRCQYDPAGNPVQFPGAAIDITDRKITEQALAQSESFNRTVLESISDAFYAVGTDWRFTYINARAEKLLGRRREDLLGKVYWDEFPQAVGSLPYQAHLEAARNRKVVRCEARSMLSGSWIDLSIFPSATGLSVYFRDITDRKRAEARLSEVATNLSLAIEATELGMWEIDLSTGEIVWSDRTRLILGTPADSRITAETVYETLHPEDVPATRAAFARMLNPELREDLNIEFRILDREGGPQRWVVARARAFVDGETGSEIGRVIGTVLDITEKKRSEEHLRLLVNELNHRVKNSLAMVQAVAAQTLRSTDSLAEARDSFTARLISLAKAHDLLTSENWEGTDLREVVSRTMESHIGGDEERFRISGPSVRLTPKTALSLSMAFHELATNAVKYGALSNDFGRIEIAWSVAVTEQARHLHLTWRESGGPTVLPPTRRGFGSRLIERGLAAELGGTVTIEYHPEGLACTVDAPLPSEDRGQNHQHA